MGARPPRRWRLLAHAALVLVLTAVAVGCTEEPPGATATDGVTGVTGNDPAADSVVEQYAGEEASFGTVPDEPTVADGEPIEVGLINQEDVPMGSFPEVRLGALAAAEFINTELGGVGGRPIEIIPCITNFSVEGSQGCAQELVQQDVVAVAGGLDITSNGSIPVLEQNGIPYVGGIPINFDEMSSPISFQFSGGTPGAMVAYAQHAADVGAERVAVVYPDYAPVKAAAVDYGVALLEALGVPEIAEVTYPITATDMLPILSQADANDPDAILMFAADAACVRTMQTARDLQITADIYLVGSCAAPAILEEAGDAAEGIIVSIEGPLGPDGGFEDTYVDGQLYLAASERYDETFTGPNAGTVSFRTIMNLYAILAEIGPDDVSPQTIIEAFRATVDQPSWDGHPYTCDGEQVPDLPALCSPQQVLARIDESGLTPESDGWIDVPAIIAEHLE